MTAEQGGNPIRYPIDKSEITVSQENDQYGHLNYANWPKLFEPGQDAYMNSRGIGFDAIERDFGLRSFVKEFSIKIMQALKRGEEASVTTTIGEVGRASITFQQTLIKDGLEAAQYEIKVTLVDQEGNSTPVPDQIREALLIQNPKPQEH